MYLFLYSIVLFSINFLLRKFFSLSAKQIPFNVTTHSLHSLNSQLQQLLSQLKDAEATIHQLQSPSTYSQFIKQNRQLDPLRDRIASKKQDIKETERLLEQIQQKQYEKSLRRLSLIRVLILVGSFFYEEKMEVDSNPIGTLAWLLGTYSEGILTVQYYRLSFIISFVMN